MNRRTFLMSLLAAPVAAVAAARLTSPIATSGPMTVTFTIDTLDANQFLERYLRPAAAQLADQIDADLLRSLTLRTANGSFEGTFR